MNGYSRQLIAELSEQLDERIVRFFESTKNDYKYAVDSVNELVEYTLEESFNGKTTKEDLRTFNNNEMRNRRKKKQRWLAKLEDDVKNYAQNDLRYPFSRLVGQRAVLDNGQWKTLYGDKSLDDIIQDQLGMAREWATQTDSLFISFPGINSQTPTRIFESLVSDTAISLYQYIVENYDGSIENYFFAFPMELIGLPLFAPKKVRLSATANEDNEIVETYDYGEGVLETSTSLQAVNAQLISMDQNDLKILYSALQNLDVDFYTTRQARVKKRTLVRLLHTRPGKKHYDSMEEHCHKLSRYNFSVTANGKKKVSFNLIDSVDTTAADEVVFTFGNLLYNGIIDNEIANIKSANFQLLENNVSTILYQSLFRERIILSTKNTSDDAELVADYSFNFFHSNVRLPNQTKKKNMDMIAESLDEFVEKKIFIKSYERKSTYLVRICFYPLSPEERADLTLNRYRNLQGLPENDDDYIEIDE